MGGEGILTEEAAEGLPSTHLPPRVRRLELLAVEELGRAVPRAKVERHGPDRVARTRERHALLQAVAAAVGAGQVSADASTDAQGGAASG